MYDVWRTICREPEGPCLIAANVVGLILVLLLWLNA